MIYFPSRCFLYLSAMKFRLSYGEIERFNDLLNDHCQPCSVLVVLLTVFYSQEKSVLMNRRDNPYSY